MKNINFDSYYLHTHDKYDDYCTDIMEHISTEFYEENEDFLLDFNIVDIILSKLFYRSSSIEHDGKVLERLIKLYKLNKIDKNIDRLFVILYEKCKKDIKIFFDKENDLFYINILNKIFLYPNGKYIVDGDEQYVNISQENHNQYHLSKHIILLYHNYKNV